MSNKLVELEASFKKKHVVQVRSGDTVRVHQRIKEGSKERVQVFEGLVIRTKRDDSHTATFTVRRISSGVGVEKTFMVHSPFVEKIEVIKRSKVRRNYLSYMRQRSGKSARLAGVDFDKSAVNTLPVEEQVTEDLKSEEPKTEDVAVKEESSEAKDEVGEKAEEKPAQDQTETEEAPSEEEKKA